MMSPCWAHVGMLIGWDTTFDAVTENLTVTAQYEEDLVVIVDEDVPEAQGATTMDDEEVPEAFGGRISMVVDTDRHLWCWFNLLPHLLLEEKEEGRAEGLSARG